ncbi:hypothetical protein SK128_024362 [Halocaridina rubra]|uniref:Uncharacterized protein n=1 Tax=Halocaridina rubra TaxID=373956 RepID=A0AAN9A427_HALRR
MEADGQVNLKTQHGFNIYSIFSCYSGRLPLSYEDLVQAARYENQLSNTPYRVLSDSVRDNETAQTRSQYYIRVKQEASYVLLTGTCKTVAISIFPSNEGNSLRYPNAFNYVLCDTNQGTKLMRKDERKRRRGRKLLSIEG